MEKVAIVVLADSETHGDLGRVVNALGTAKEFKKAGDDVQIVFDGGGTTWIAKANDPEHPISGMFESVEDVVAGACSYCAAAFGVKDEVKERGVTLLDEHEGHPSIRKLVTEGYQVLTF